ncbi:MAG: fimbrillin family protein [Prevotella sp.]
MLTRSFHFMRYLAVSVAATAMLTACQSNDDLPVQKPDGFGTITFSASTEKGITRASSYEPYSDEKHPQTMGVFGFYELPTVTDAASLPSKTILGNISFTYDTENKTWGYTNAADVKYWPDYVAYESFDFLGYMPYQGTQPAFAPVAETPSTFALSFPVSRSEICGLPFIFDSRQAPLISNLPVHESAAMGDVINLLFDQTLTGFNIQFMIDPSMDKIRHFRMKGVNVYGDKLPVSGVVSRSYTWDAGQGTWSASSITWSDIAVEKVEAADPINIEYVSDGSDTNYDDETKTVIVTSEKYRKWGKNFYTIPMDAFNPTICVTYDVELTDADGNNVTTRKDITSRIVLSKTNFSGLKTGQPGHVNAIRILIKPRYLYVLADEDKAEGLLLVE